MSKSPANSIIYNFLSAMMQNYSDKFIYQNTQKFNFFDNEMQYIDFI